MSSTGAAIAQSRLLLERSEPLTSFTISDLDRDGREEMIVAGATDVWRYDRSAAGWREIDRVALPAGQSIIHLDAMDLDRDGYEEVLVSSAGTDGPGLFVLAAGSDGKWKLAGPSAPWFARVVRPCVGTNGPACVVGQRGRAATRFAGPVHYLEWKEKTWQAGDRVDLPRRTNIYDFQPIAHDRQLVATVAASGQVRLWERGGVRWQTVDRFPSRYSARRGLCLDALESPYEPTVVAGTECLPLPPTSLRSDEKQRLVWIAQAPALGQAIGRVPYWRDWEVVSSALPPQGTGAVHVTPGEDGAVMEIAPSPQGQLLVLVQRGRDDPLVAPLKSQLIEYPIAKGDE